MERSFRWLWAAYTAGVLGSWLGFGAFPLIAILVLNARPVEVALLAAVGPAVGAVIAVPLGPWMEFRRKRPVMVAMDLIRCGALLSIPAAFALGRLTVGQLMVVAVVVAAADITFRAASGAYLKVLLSPADRLAANGRFEASLWTATVVGPPLGNAALGLFGPVTTVVIDAVSYLLSAAGVRAAVPSGRDPDQAGCGRPATPRTVAKLDGRRSIVPATPRTVAVFSGRRFTVPSILRKGTMCDRRRSTVRSTLRRGATFDRRRSTVPLTLRKGAMFDGWRFIVADPVLRALFANTVLVNALIMASAPLVAVLMIDRLGFAPWQYGLAFGAPCIGGLLGSRLTRPMVSRHGTDRVLRVAGTLRACWPVGLAFIGSGAAGFALVITVQFMLVTCMGVFNPVFATHRLDRTPPDRVARTLTAWSITGNAATAVTTAVWGLLATVAGLRTAIAVAGLLLLASPLLLPRCMRGGSAPAVREEPQSTASGHPRP